MDCVVRDTTASTAQLTHWELRVSWEAVEQFVHQDTTAHWDPLLQLHAMQALSIRMRRDLESLIAFCAQRDSTAQLVACLSRRGSVLVVSTVMEMRRFLRPQLRFVLVVISVQMQPHTLRFVWTALTKMNLVNHLVFHVLQVNFAHQTRRIHSLALWEAIVPKVTDTQSLVQMEHTP